MQSATDVLLLGCKVELPEGCGNQLGVGELAGLKLQSRTSTCLVLALFCHLYL